jgi:hypothetical protein
MSGYVVELCGVAGSGKSRLAAALVAALLERGVSAVDASFRATAEARSGRLTRKAGLVLASIASSPWRAGVTARAVASAGTGRRELLARTVNLVATDRLVRRGRADDVVSVLDQGLLQELGSIGVSGAAELTAARLHTDHARADLLVVVEVDGEEAVARLRQRGTGESRVERIPGDPREALERQEEWLERLIGIVVEECSVVRVRHDDGATPEVANALADLVVARLSPRRGSRATRRPLGATRRRRSSP